MEKSYRLKIEVDFGKHWTIKQEVNVSAEDFELAEDALTTIKNTLKRWEKNQE